MKVNAYEHAGYTDYLQCWTGEMAMRPIPFISTDEKPLRAQQYMAKYLPAVFDYLVPKCKPHIQPINKISALGYPITGNPGTGLNEDGVKEFESKFDVVLTYFQELQAGDYSLYDEGYHTIGVRLQIESPEKVRRFQFIDDDGTVFEQDITGVDREIEVRDLGTMIGSRTRTIVRPPILNLWLQCWDSMIHNAIMEHPLCDSNVYTHERWPDGANFLTFDCKHYERYLGMAAITYAEHVGGIYGEKLDMMIRYPFIVPSASWRSFFRIQPLYSPGRYPQFSSGLSPVAPLGKLTNICAQMAYFVEHLGYNIQTAVVTVLGGTSPGLRRWMYGDDNRVMGDRAKMDDYVRFMGDVFDIEVEDRPKYLGMVYVDEKHEFMLPAETYVTKLYQPERDFSFKDYPFLGIMERRNVFSNFGEPVISSKLIPYEDKLWDAVDMPYHAIVGMAMTEKTNALRAGLKINKWDVTDKDYLMTDQEKADSGQYWHLTGDVVATIVNAIVGPKIKERLIFRDAPFAKVPEPMTTLKPFEQNKHAYEEESDSESSSTTGDYDTV